MTRVQRTFWAGVVLVCLACPPARAQDLQFLPEVDAHLKLNSRVRVYLQAKNDRDAGASDQLEIGPSVQLYLKPLIKLTKINTFDLDDAKSRVSVLETGYRYIAAPNAAPENRMQAIDTLHFPMKAGLLLSDRNRADLDWKSGEFTWHYRNKLSLEKTFSIDAVHLIPYIAAEPYYESQYHKWSTTALYAGCYIPLGRYVQFNSYYEHENNTGKKPNQQTNEIGLALYLYFSLDKK